ncbi:SacI domain containing protein [Histomonas meleagridis]|uniref:SacI-like domain containing protein n=1 Tax=Histomonas meleagridis TaxID=135588 RepID=UPI00355A1BB8|nr:SacI domain containing protein [Histomonas meleagridis]KAH0805678.1 SacI-like domain containing protein [Histomonas meleagridis]
MHSNASDFDDPGSFVEIYPTDDNVVLILLKKSTAISNYLFTVNKFTGSIESFTHTSGISMFTSTKEALAFMEKNYKLRKNEKKRGIALIGIAKFGPIVYIPIVTKVSLTAMVLNKCAIYTIKDVYFYSFKLPFHPALQGPEERRVNRMTGYPFTDLHFYCENHDFTSPIWSDKHHTSFVWNEFWVKPFEAVHQRDVCVNLLQGTVSSEVITIFPSDILVPRINQNNSSSNSPESSPLNSIDKESTEPPVDSNGKSFKITLITIREAANGGTRYFARGVDKNGYAGNEVQCELIVETCDGRVWSTVWRRGTAPIIWRSIIGKNLPSVSHVVDKSSFYSQYTSTYFDRLKEEFNEIICVDLLHNTLQASHDEYEIHNSFATTVAKIDKVSHISYDWHSKVKEKTIPEATKELLNIFEPDYSFSFPKSDSDKNDFPPPPERSDKIPSFLFGNENGCIKSGNNFIEENKQKIVYRLNCLDSLDRTNIGCFFYAMKCLSIILHELRICEPITKEYPVHKLFAMPMKVRQFMARAFISIGDCISLIYTNTNACMTDVLLEIGGIKEKTESDSGISVQRRYHNMVTDRKRNKLFALFNGRLFDTYLPSIDTTPIPMLVSGDTAHIFPKIINKNINLECLLSDRLSTIQISDLKHLNIKSDIDSIEPMHAIRIMLNDYCYITQIVMNLIPPFPPSSISLYQSLNDQFEHKIELVKNIAIPQVNTPTPISILIPPDYSTAPILARYLIIQFHTKNPMITLSNIYVFGYKKPIYFQKAYPETFANLPIPNENDSKITTHIMEKKNLESYLQSIQGVDNEKVIQIESLRIKNRLSHLELYSKIPLYNANLKPLDCNIKNLRFKPITDDISEKICCKCHHKADFVCMICEREFCHECVISIEVLPDFFFEGKGFICNQCDNYYQKVRASYSDLMALNFDYYRTDPIPLEEQETLAFLSAYKLNVVQYDPTQFPYAFFQSTRNSYYNLVLTNEGGEIDSSGKNLVLSLGLTMRIIKIDIESSNDLRMTIADESQSKLLNIEAKVSKSINCDLEGNMFYLGVNNGTLNKLVLQGIRKHQLIQPQNMQISKVKQEQIKEVKCKQVQGNNNQTFKLTMKNEKMVKGLIMRELAGVNSLIIVFHEPKKDEIFFTEAYYLPMGAPYFVLRFENKIPKTKHIDVIFYDVDSSYNEPKIMLFE